MLRFSFNKRLSRFDVVGPVDEVTIGLVQVQKRDGTTRTECVTKLGPIFETADGPYRFGTLRAVPTKLHRPVDQPQQEPVITRSGDGRTVEIRIDEVD